MYGEKKAQHTSIKTSSQLWSMMEGASWFGAALLPQGLDSLLSSMKKWIPKFIKTFCRRMLDYLSTNWISTEVGWCNSTMTQNKEVNQQQNGFNRRKYALWSGPVSPDFNLIWDDVAWPQRAVHTRHLKNTAELKQFCKEDWSIIPPDRCAGLIRNYRKCLVEVIAAVIAATLLLNPKVPILFPPCTVKVYTVCAIKTWKRIIVCVLLV